MKKHLLFLFVMLCGMMVFAQEKDRSALGFSAIYGNYEIRGGEVYWKKSIRIFRRSAELKAGAGIRTQLMKVRDVEGLETTSVNLFGDVFFYPFHQNGLFIGLRAEPFNLNFMSKDAFRRYEEQTYESFTDIFSGSAIYGQLGYQFKLGNVFRIRLYGQPGMQQYQITPLGTGQLYNQTEYYYRFIYNLNAGIEFKLK